MPAVEREAPQALEAERAILGALMLERPLVARVRPALAPAAFYRTAHATIYRAILALDDRGEGSDPVALAQELRAAGELEPAGGPEALAALLDSSSSASNIDHHVRLMRLASAARQAIALGRELEQAAGNGAASGVTFSDLLASYGTRLEEIRQAAEPGARAPSLEQQTRTDLELFAAPRARPEDLIGTGYVVAGGLTLMASLPGFGKTQLWIQAMRALAAGEPWLGMPTARARSLMLQMETPEYNILERLRSPLGGMTEWLIMPEGFSRLEERATLDSLCALIERRAVRLVVLDPLHALHGGNINFDDELEPFLNAVRLLRRRTGAAVVLLHHVNKLEWDKHASLRTNVLRSIKGSGRLTSDPDTVQGLVERAGRLVLVNAKTRLGPSVEYLAIRQDPASGWFELTATPEQVSSESDLKITRCLEHHGARGVALEQLATECSLSTRTARRHLERLGAVALRGEHGALRFFQASAAPEQGEVPL